MTGLEPMLMLVNTSSIMGKLRRSWFSLFYVFPRLGGHSINIAPGKDRDTGNRKPFRVGDPTFEAATR